jgi:predicted Zn-dependent protease
VPLFNQPNELASDVYGIQNVLQAGKDGQGWKEDGALLMLRAFRARTRQSLQDSLVFGFERTHPHPDLRIPVVEQTARTWRLSGGRSLPKLPNVRL